MFHKPNCISISSECIHILVIIVTYYWSTLYSEKFVYSIKWQTIGYYVFFIGGEAVFWPLTVSFWQHSAIECISCQSFKGMKIPEFLRLDWVFLLGIFWMICTMTLWGMVKGTGKNFQAHSLKIQWTSSQNLRKCSIIFSKASLSWLSHYLMVVYIVNYYFHKHWLVQSYAEVYGRIRASQACVHCTVLPIQPIV